MNNSLIIFLFIFFLTAFIYKNIWKFFLPNLIPSGFGIFLIIYFFFFNIIELNNLEIFTFNNKNIITLLFILLLGLVYYLDDIINVPIILRIILQLFSGIIIAILLLDYNILNTSFYIILFAFGAANILLVNTLNFYDGADLNLSILSTSIFLPILLFLNLNDFSYNLIIFTIIFILTFSIYNFFPKNLYFGDSGCFVISCFILILITEIEKTEPNFLLMTAGLYFPIIDVVFVIIKRLFSGENLFTRNHYHIYQIFKNNIGGFYYLLILPINSIIIISLIYFMIDYNINIFQQLLILFLSSLILYLILKILLFNFTEKTSGS
jgi:UDP-N-acetylmuramyl pentapeptide phosphotransferase/UDP-N-acetylglucosamine-1-phosphate transferase